MSPWRGQPGEGEGDWVMGEAHGWCGVALGEADWTEAPSRENGADGGDFGRFQGRQPWHGDSLG